MFIELLDLLRCINPHEDTWLVASFKAVTNRFVLEGTLGCPICSAEYPIRNGVADFRTGAEIPRRNTKRSAATRDREELATRAGAFLNVTEPGATVVLGGRWADAALELSLMTEARVLALNPDGGAEESETVGLLRVGSEIPVAPGSVLGVATRCVVSGRNRRVSGESGPPGRKDRRTHRDSAAGRAGGARPGRGLLGGAEGAGSDQAIACWSVNPDRSASS